MLDDKKKHWMQLYIHEWRGDPALNKMRRENVKSWLDCVMLMFSDYENYYVQGTRRDLSRVLGISLKEFDAFVRDLRSTGTAEVQQFKGAEAARIAALDLEKDAPEGAPRGQKDAPTGRAKTCPTIFRIISRRAQRLWESRKYERERKAAQRAEKMSREKSGDVPDKVKVKVKDKDNTKKILKKEFSLKHTHRRHRELADRLSEEIAAIVASEKWNGYREKFEPRQGEDRFTYIERLEASGEYAHIGGIFELHIELIRNENYARMKKLHCTPFYFETKWLGNAPAKKNHHQESTNGNGNGNGKKIQTNGSAYAPGRNGNAKNSEQHSDAAARVGAKPRL